MAALVLESVQLKFHNQVVLKDISFTLEEGQILVLLGPNDSGKSALINLLATLEQQDSGRLLLLGREVAAMDEAEIGRLRQELGAVFEEGGLLQDFTVLENLQLPLARRLVAAKEVNERVTYWLDLLEIEEYSHRLPHTLTDGILRKVALARALISQPRLLLCDEVTTGLDDRSSRQIEEVILRLKREWGLTTVFVTHRVDAALRLADLIAVLDEGHLIYFGLPENINLLADQEPALRWLLESLPW
ncbi:MAG: ATP-binding cassette domain-containing protein [Magnetococcales bacterium]|nr:ATP-binding cassette domain-containing protein [Magnetococcales bacterium]NGZ27579.1 ATP-binding cassette domain-containing protein [Magnetococcales bacterium]